MGLHLRYGTAYTAGAALVGLSIYAIFKSGALRPVLVGAIRGGMKAADWVGEKATCLKNGVAEMVEEAKAEQTKQAKPVARVAKPAAKAPAKPVSKPVSKSAARVPEAAKA